MKRLIFLCICLTAAIVPGFAGLPVLPPLLDFNAPWELIESRGNMRLYKHPRPHENLHAFKLDMSTRVPLENLLSIILDVPSYCGWVPNCSDVKVLERFKDGSLVYYLSVDMPWPASNRDWVNKLSVYRPPDNSYVKVTFTAFTDYYPPKASHIRVTEHRAQWFMKPVGSSQTRSIWQWYTDPGGHLPGWLIERASRDQVMESIRNIQKLVLK